MTDFDVKIEIERGPLIIMFFVKIDIGMGFQTGRVFERPRVRSGWVLGRPKALKSSSGCSGARFSKKAVGGFSCAFDVFVM